MTAVFKREIRAYFYSPLGYVFIGAIFFFTGYFVYIYNILSGTTDSSRLFGQLFTAALLLIPTLTMRLLSEERRLRTERQLFAAPVTLGAIIAGKYFSALFVYAVAISGVIPEVAVLSLYGRTDWPVIFGNYFGLLFLGAALIAVCMFLSSLTESQFIAAVMGFAVGLILLLLDAASLNMGAGAAQKFLLAVSFNNRYTPFTMGIFDFAAAAYFISVAALFAALAAAVSEKRRSGASPRFYAYVLSLVAVFILFNAVINELDDQYQPGVDLTARSVYRLDRRTISALENLDKPVDIYMLAVKRNFAGSPYMTQALNLMEQYPRYSSHLSFTLVDAAADPTFAARFPGRSLDTGDILVVCEGRVKQIKLADLFNFSLNPEGTSMIISSSRVEEALTSAIAGAAANMVKQVSLLVGNDVKTPRAFISLLENNNFQVDEINLVTRDIPDESVLALLFGPGADYADNELSKLDAYLYNGGAYGKTLMYTADPSRRALPGIETFLREWGVSVEDGAVYETDANRTFQYIPFYPIADYADVYYKSKLTDRASAFLMPLARQLQLKFAFKDNNAAEILLAFGESAVVRPSDAPPDFTADDATTRGPLPALVLATKRASGSAAGGMMSGASGGAAGGAEVMSGEAGSASGGATGGIMRGEAGSANGGAAGGIMSGDSEFAKSYIVVSASTDMLEEMCVRNASLANGEYLLNLINDLTGGEVVVNIAPKSLAGRNLAVPTRVADVLGILFIGVVPACILIFGVAMWLIRRRG